MSKNMMEPERPQIKIYYGACTLHAGYIRLHVHMYTHKPIRSRAATQECIIQGGSNMTGTNCDLFTHNQSRSYLNHLALTVFHGK
jgi:hypothetical protein